MGENVLGKLLLQVFLPAVVAGYGLSTAPGLESYLAFFTPANTAFVCAVIPILIYYLGVLFASPKHERGPIGALLAIFAVVIVFWMIFHQNGNTLTLWARDYTDREAGALASVLEFFYMDEQAPDSYWENVPPAERPDPGETTTLISTELFQSINPFCIILFTPLVVGFFGWLWARKKEPSTPAKITWGLFITALSTF